MQIILTCSKSELYVEHKIAKLMQMIVRAMNTWSANKIMEAGTLTKHIADIHAATNENNYSLLRFNFSDKGHYQVFIQGRKNLNGRWSKCKSVAFQAQVIQEPHLWDL